ncbi:MAG: hypothetical protein GWN73_15875, partial [Actinobacteria bacterium]|nr:hypothetical protein [Actinomycetota bacterium]NIU66814.1 hypothetical protein [Actinomycetota bacterium]
IPEFKRVVISFNGQIEMENTLDAALAAVFGAPPDGDDEPPDDAGDGPVEVPEEVAALLAAAADAFEAADAALRDGDLAAYQDAIDEARAFLERARELAGGAVDQGTQG